MDQFNVEAMEVFVNLWAKKVGITDGCSTSQQVIKLKEEVNELGEEILFKNEEKAKMELGDCLILLAQIANRLNTSFIECLSMAYDKISTRPGRMSGGEYIKDKL